MKLDAVNVYIFSGLCQIASLDVIVLSAKEIQVVQPFLLTKLLQY